MGTPWSRRTGGDSPGRPAAQHAPKRATNRPQPLALSARDSDSEELSTGGAAPDRTRLSLLPARAADLHDTALLLPHSDSAGTMI